MTDRPTALEFKDAVKKFGRRKALDGFSMCVPRGSTFGLVGSNGAGKTTSIAVATGTLNLSGGAVKLLGEGPFDPTRHAGRVSMMPQDADLPLYARVRDILIFYARLQGIPDKQIKNEVDKVIEWVHLCDRATSPVRTLSHGMRRRIVVAQAFLGNPELVLLDEPMSGLDPREVINIRELLRRGAGKQTVVISSHNLHELELVCDHVAFIEKGKLVRQDSMEEITGKSRVINYLLVSTKDLPLDKLRELLPDAVIDLKENGTVLSCGYPESGHSDAEINRIILKQLLDNNIEIMEVRRGKNLESAYISHSSSTS